MFIYVRPYFHIGDISPTNSSIPSQSTNQLHINILITSISIIAHMASLFYQLNSFSIHRDTQEVVTYRVHSDKARVVWYKGLKVLPHYKTT